MPESSESLLAELVATGRLTQEEADAILARTIIPEPVVSETSVGEPSFPAPASIPVPSYYPSSSSVSAKGTGERKLPLLPILLITIGTFLVVAAVASLFALLKPFDGPMDIIIPLFLSFFIFTAVGFVLQLKPSSTTRRAASALYAAALPSFFWALSLLLVTAAINGEGYTYYYSDITGEGITRTTLFIIFLASGVLTLLLSLLAYWRASAVITQITLAYSVYFTLSSLVYILPLDSETPLIVTVSAIFALVTVLWYVGIQKGVLRQRKIAEVIAALSLTAAIPTFFSLFVSGGGWVGVSLLLSAAVIFLLWRLLPVLREGNTSLILAILVLLIGLETIIASLFTGLITVLFGLFLAIIVISAGIVWWVMAARRSSTAVTA